MDEGRALFLNVKPGMVGWGRLSGGSNKAGLVVACDEHWTIHIWEAEKMGVENEI